MSLNSDLHRDDKTIEGAVNCNIYGDNNTLEDCVNCTAWGNNNKLEDCVDCTAWGYNNKLEDCVNCNSKEPKGGKTVSRSRDGGSTYFLSLGGGGSRAPRTNTPKKTKVTSAIGRAARQKAKRLTVATFLDSDRYNHFRTLIFAAMDETDAWENFLEERGLLGGDEVEKYVSNLKHQWATNRGGEPTLTVIRDLVDNDSDFGDKLLVDFATELLELNIEDVNAAVVKLTSFLEAKEKKAKKKNSTAYTAQANLRSWLLGNLICEEEEVDTLIKNLRESGVKGVSSLDGFEKDDLKDLGFNTVQAILTIKALNRKATKN